MYCFRSQIGLDRPSPQNNSGALRWLVSAEDEQDVAAASSSALHPTPSAGLAIPTLLCGRACRAGGSCRRENLSSRRARRADLRLPLGQSHLPCMSNANRIKSAVRGMPSFPLMTVHALAIVL